MTALFRGLFHLISEFRFKVSRLLFILACSLCAWPLARAETLEAGLVGYLALDGDLRMVTPGGEETLANFVRPTRAFTDDLRPLDEHVPRIVAGRFGEGVWLEPGYEGARTPECRNWLDPATAEILPDETGLTAYGSVGDAQLDVLVWEETDTGNGILEVLEGAYALRIACPAPATGAESVVVSIPEGSYFLSLYARCESAPVSEETIRLEAIDATNAVLGSADVTISADWRRVALSFDAGSFVRDVDQQKLRDVRFRVLGTRAGQTLVVDAVMLEMAGGFSYAGMGQASSWLPGNARRAPEMLNVDTLRHVLGGGVGSAAFWVQLRGEKQWRRTLFEIASGNRWEPFLQLRLQQGRLMMGPRTNAPADVVAAVSAGPGEWHHYAVTWGDGAATMYFDGQSVGELAGLRLPTETASYRLGSLGAGTSANAVVDEAVFYRRRLGSDEVMVLAARTTPLGEKIAPSVTIRPEHFLGTIAHGTEAQPWRCTVLNHGTNTVFDLEVALQIGDGLRVSQHVSVLQPGKSADIEFRFLADLTLGHYPLRVVVAAGERTLATFARTVEITPAPTPFENLQVSPWGFNSASEYGMTCGGGDVEDAMRRGLHWNPRQNYLGYPRAVEGEDLVQDMNGNPGRARFDSPYMAEQVAREAERMGRRFAGIPAMRGIILNSEMQWIWTHDFTPENVDWVQQTFELNLDFWRNPPNGNENNHQTPYGRLLPAIGGYSLPLNRIVRIDDPLYAYHRWFHGPQAPTEVYLNQTLGSAIQAHRPDILTIQEPILRRPSVRAFDRMSLAQEWFYYENPMTAVSVQERLNAVVRGTSLRITGMPQFLFKAGTAAPFNAMPTADLFYETAWLCALQPIRMMTYWNFGPVPDLTYSDAYNQLFSKAQLDTLFGSATPTWEQVQDVLAAQPVPKLMTWTPELIATFKKFHVEAVGPLGGLIPEWQNRPRRLAILRSFANELYGGIRWPTFTRLENGAVYSGVPFDVLYDEDFEGGEDALASYQMVIVSGTVCLTQPTFDALQSFITRGGVVAVDAGTRVEIPGALQIELAVAGDRPNHTEPALMQALEAHMQPEARSLTPNTWMNLLTAEEVNYIGVVNDLRVSGPMFGHFGKVRETGVPQTATVVYASALGAVVYDLLASRQVEMSQGEGQNTLQLELPPGGARLVMLLPRPIGPLSASATIVSARWGDHGGREIQLEAALRDVDGQLLPGLVPATITLLAPDGTRSDFSRHSVFRRGRLTCQFPVLSNGQTGTWRIHVQERASGQETVVTVENSTYTAGANSSISAGDWNDGTVWSLGRPPLAGDDVTVMNEIVLGQTTDRLRSFTINNATLIFTNWFTALVADEVNVDASGMLTCAGPFTNAPAMSNRVWIVCSNVTVAANGKIDVDGKGYAGGVGAGESGNGPGAGICVGWNPITSGGYGGRGGFTGASAPVGGDVYGLAVWPEQPGSGGTAGHSTPSGGAGGGAICIEASDTVTIDGHLTACGKIGATYTASGSGGGVLVTGRVICGSGSILADGGNRGYSGDAGGGGRIALHYQSTDQQALAARPTLTISAASGNLRQGVNSVCELGSLWFSDRSFLGVHSVANIRGWLHIAGFTNWSVPSLALTNAFVGFTEPNFTLEVSTDVTVAGSGAIAFANGASVTIGGDCQGGVQLIDGRLEVAGNLTPAKMSTDNYQCRFSETEVSVGGDIVIANSWMFMSAPSNGLRVCGSQIEAGGLMRFGGNATLYLASNPTNGGSALLRCRDFVLDAGALINAVGLGFGGASIGQSGYGYGGGKCLNYGGGGGYGGRGGGTEASHGLSNGLAYAPLHPGSGGGAYSTTMHPGAAGGGFVHIEATKSATINGVILADGTAAYYAGAGSGGGILIRTRRFAGGATAMLRANGGSHAHVTPGKRGGGGRICVWYDDMPESMAELLFAGRHQEIGECLMATTTYPGFNGATYEGTVEALAGQVHSSGPAGEEDGTVFFVRILPSAGTLFQLQ